MKVIHAGSGADVHVGFLVGIAVVLTVTTLVFIAEGIVVAAVLAVVVVVIDC
jgi:hypothetical protein